MDAKISALHGAKAFKEFITLNKRVSVPKFLEQVQLESPPPTAPAKRNVLSNLQ